MELLNLEKVTSLRHTLHRHPELSMQETETMKILQTFLGETTSLEIHAGKGWFYALKKASPSFRSGGSNAGPMAFRADMDALPIAESINLPYGSEKEGISHKCGHDGHCAVLCGLALELDRRETDRDVYLIFQPGEEIGAGAKRCAELIRERGIAEIYAMHNLGGYAEGTLVYRRGLTQPASEGLRIRLTGRTSHASAPEKGNNPAGVIAAIVQYASGEAALTWHGTAAISVSAAQLPRSDPKTATATDAQHTPMRLCTITGIRLGDGDFGISPGEGEICMTLRAEIEDEMLAMEKSILSYAAQAAETAGLKMTSSIHDYFPETRNHDACLDKVLEAARKNKTPAISMGELWRASEDFGHYLKICPGAMIYIGNGEEYPPLHTSEYDFNDRIIEPAVDLFTGIALSGIPSD